MTQQSGLQRRFREESGTTLDWNGDMIACSRILTGVSDGDANAHLFRLTQLATQSGASDLPAQLQAYADMFGATNWSSCGYNQWPGSWFAPGADLDFDAANERYLYEGDVYSPESDALAAAGFTFTATGLTTRSTTGPWESPSERMARAVTASSILSVVIHAQMPSAPPGTGNQCLWSRFQGADNYEGLFQNTAGALNYFAVVAGVVAGSVQFGTPANGADIKVAIARKANDFRGAIGGSLTNHDVTGSIPLATSEAVMQFNGGSHWNGTCARIIEFEGERISDATMQSLTG